jgi:hypothetical protein
MLVLERLAKAVAYLQSVLALGFSTHVQSTLKGPLNVGEEMIMGKVRFQVIWALSVVSVLIITTPVQSKQMV